MTRSGRDIPDGLPTIGILTVLPEVELPAIKLAFGIRREQLPIQSAGERYWITSAETASGQTYRIVISCIGLSGNAESTLLTERMVNKFAPELMILVGVGCGIRRFALGDVATSDAIWAYEYVKTQLRGDLDRSRAKVTPRHIQDDIFFFSQLANWRRSLKSQATRMEPHLKPRADVPSPSLHKAQWMASGEKVMGSGDLERLNKRHDLIRVGEMEGYGFALACEKRRPPVPWLVIRGISDHGDILKEGSPVLSAPQKDEYHGIAAQSAAALCKTFLLYGYTRAAEGDASRAQGTRDGAGTGHSEIISVFSSDYDPGFNSALLRAFRNAATSIVIAGMGLSFFKGNTELISAIALAVKKNLKLAVEIYYGDVGNSGIQNRVREEAIAAGRQQRPYSETWPTDHIVSLQSELTSKLTDSELARVRFSPADCLPMITVVRADQVYFWYAYGTPNIRGKESPWLFMEEPNAESSLRAFLDANIDYYRSSFVHPCSPAL